MMGKLGALALQGNLEQRSRMGNALLSDFMTNDTGPCEILT